MELKEIETPVGIKSSVLTVRMNGGGRGEVLIDGRRVKNCRGVTVRSEIGHATAVTLDLIGLTVDIEAEADEILAEVTDASSVSRQYRIVT